MKKRSSLILVLLIFLPGSASAAAFTATIDRNHIGTGESVTLQLSLSGAEARGDPDIGVLRQSFTVVSEDQSSNTAIINGTTSSSVGWHLTLIPKREGQLTIPPVAINTATGRLSSEPVTLNVDQGSPRTSSYSGVGQNMISITATSNNATPFQNQPIIYTIRCVARADISDVSLSDINVGNAIVEQQGKPDVQDQSENGVPVKVIEFHFIITPLQPGQITIPSVLLQGNVETPDRDALPDPIFGEDFTGLAGMLKAMNSFAGFVDEKPFSVASNKTVLNVKPPAAMMDPWLPLTSLKIKEDTDVAQSVQVGEPLTRKITLLADGVVGSQLPDIKTQQANTDFRVYADKPTMGEDIDTRAGVISGWRKQSYTLIPQRAGRLVLPAIKVSWWDVANNKAVTSELPERVVDVVPGVAAQSPLGAGTGAMDQSQGKASRSWPKLLSLAETMFANAGKSLLNPLLGILAAALLLAAFWWSSLTRGIKRHAEDDAMAAAATKPQRKKLASRSISEREMEHIRTARELKDMLHACAYELRGMSLGASLEDIFLALQKTRTGQEREDVEAVVRGLNAALYAGKTVDVEDLKRRCQRILAKVKIEGDDNQKGGKKLPSLNPS